MRRELASVFNCADATIMALERQGLPSKPDDNNVWFSRKRSITWLTDWIEKKGRVIGLALPPGVKPPVVIEDCRHCNKPDLKRRPGGRPPDHKCPVHRMSCSSYRPCVGCHWRGRLPSFITDHVTMPGIFPPVRPGHFRVWVCALRIAGVVESCTGLAWEFGGELYKTTLPVEWASSLRTADDVSISLIAYTEWPSISSMAVGEWRVAAACHACGVRHLSATKMVMPPAFGYEVNGELARDAAPHIDPDLQPFLEGHEGCEASTLVTVVRAEET
jgi:hypothetical protein